MATVAEVYVCGWQNVDSMASNICYVVRYATYEV